MKKEMLIGIVGIVAIIVGSFVIWYSYNKKQDAIVIHTINSSTITNSIQNKLNANSASGATILDTTMITQHNTTNDCWLLINNKVYDVSSYLTSHPGGSATIIPYCGKDATVAFDSKGGQGSHSAFAQSELAQFVIGTVGSTTTAQ
ncbi:MAG: cytochrome b5-like heme/steroid binding domain-containing protein [Patescibacteria group bacterium]|jgi:cytochrome b involved in lipid metabolism